MKVKKKRWQIAQAAEWRWWNVYLKKKDPQAYLEWKRNYWQSFLDKGSIQVAPAQTVLEVGCGPAGLFTLLPNKITAIDPLVDTYAANLKIFSREDYPNCTFYNLPFEDFKCQHTYQTIFCCNAINHFENVGQSMQQLKHNLAINGQLIISVDLHRHGYLAPIFKTIPGDILHPHQLTKKDILQLFRQHGFSITNEVILQQGTIFKYLLFTLVHT